MKKFPLKLSLLIGAGLALRLVHVVSTASMAPHPDFALFLEKALALSHPFDTSPREPLFVWWLWGLSKAGLATPFGARLATALWFIPAAAALFSLSRRFLGPRGAWAVAALYALLPAQVYADGLGLRHVLEGAGVILLLRAVSNAPASPKEEAASALAYAGLTLARMSYLVSGALLAGLGALRRKNPRALWVLAPALLLLLFHLRDNRKQFGDPFQSVNMHTTWFANLENIGRPGFAPTREEWEKDTYKGKVTFREWAFKMHSPGEVVKETAAGLLRCLWIFQEKIYFSAGLPGALKWPLLALYGAGLLLSLWKPDLRWLAAAYLALLWPYAFVSHVFWAGRFFVPFSPIALILAVAAAGEGVSFVRGVISRNDRRKTPTSGPG